MYVEIAHTVEFGTVPGTDVTIVIHELSDGRFSVMRDSESEGSLFRYQVVDSETVARTYARTLWRDTTRARDNG